MNFDKKYNELKLVVKDDLEILEENLKEIFKANTPINNELSKIVTAPAKRLRPLLGILFSKCLFGEVTSEQFNILLAVELIHNATLIHDDVIDKSDERRKQKTLNSKFDNNLAVIAGDFLLSVAMEKVINTGSIDVINLFSSALKFTCLGEINQYFNKYKVTPIDEYIEKSKEKTALLFELAILSCIYLSAKKTDKNLKKSAIDFSQNFGIAFQIRDDLINVLNSDKLASPDILSGVYTAPVIFAYEENKDILKSKSFLNVIKQTRGIEKTKDLMDNYFGKSISTIEKLENNIYKKTILGLIELLNTNI